MRKRPPSICDSLIADLCRICDSFFAENVHTLHRQPIVSKPVKEEPMSDNSLCHFEIMSRHPKKSADFYARLFGWKLNYDMGENYILFQPESGIGGGIQKADEITPGSGLAIYIRVDDIEACLKKAVDLGGKQVTGKTEIPNVGWYGQFSDLDGNTIGIYSGN